MKTKYSAEEEERDPVEIEEEVTTEDEEEVTAYDDKESGEDDLDEEYPREELSHVEEGRDGDEEEDRVITADGTHQ